MHIREGGTLLGLLRRAAQYIFAGLVVMWLTFWYLSGSPLGMVRFFYTYFVATHFFMDPVAKETLFTGSLKGMMESLGEPHSQYLDRNDFDQIMKQTSATYSGVGIVMGMGPDGLEVVSAIEEQPAAKAGVKTGDRITSINGTSTKSMSLSEASALVRGEAGTTVVLGIARGQETMDISIVREQITLPTVRSKMLTNDIGYIRISQFAEKTGTEFAEAYKELQGKGMKKLVLDLRNNPGGLLAAAQEVGSYILPKGPIVTIKDRSGHTESYDSDGLETPIPLVVLINKGSASASEIIAGAVQDEKVGTIVGTNSYGKGTVQTVVNAFGDEGIKITIAKYHTPNDRVIDGTGIAPDVTVELPSPEGRTGTKGDFVDDTQLAKAIEILQSR